MKYIGDKYGRLEVISTYVEKKNYKTNGKSYNVVFAVCKCDCGKEHSVRINALRTGNTKSCGCYESELTSARNYRHGAGLHESKGVYYAMLARCNNVNHKNYKHYGGRGIKVCEEWQSNMKKFTDWADKNGYKKGLQLDSINNDGDYEPSNCRFITAKENHRNMRSTVFFKGEVLADMFDRLSKSSGVKRQTLVSRYYKLKKYDIEINDYNLINKIDIRQYDNQLPIQ